MKKEDFKKIVFDRILILDGSLGSLLSSRNIKFTLPDMLNIENPDIILNIHKEYIRAGANILTTNTFNSSPIPLNEYGLEKRLLEINLAACKLARRAIEESNINDRPFFVAGEIGPTSKLPTFGHIGYDELKKSYTEQASALIEGGVDIILIETAQDPLQIKAAIGAAKIEFERKKRELPIIVSITHDENGRLLVGANVESVLSAFARYELTAFGLNCSRGPKEMKEGINYLKGHSPFPIICQPNAGLPQIKDGRPHYDLSPVEFGEWMETFVNEFGVRLPGGCCGTTPDHISEMSKRVLRKRTAFKGAKFKPSASSLFTAYPLVQDPPPFLIAEQTSASGSKAFRELLAKGDFNGMCQIAKEASKSSHALDINLAQPGRDEAKDMRNFLKMAITSADASLMIDSRSVSVLREALSQIPGRSIINSINLEDGEKNAREILKIASEFKAVVIALTIDEEGMAKSAKKKIEIASRLIELSKEYGLSEEDLFIDPLTFTLASGDSESRNAAVETINAIKGIRKKFPSVNTLLGVSNISYGLPAKTRRSLNSVFLQMMTDIGLGAVIINPSKIIPLKLIPKDERAWCERLILNDTSHGDPLTNLLNLAKEIKEEKGTAVKKISLEEDLERHVIEGNQHEISVILDLLIKRKSAGDIINDIMLPAMKVVGERFSKGEMPLPFVLNSAQTVKRASEILSPHMMGKDRAGRGALVLATVRGDVHDIGKDLVDIVISNNGFKVVNLGIKQPIHAILEAVEKYKADAIGLSGLLISSIDVMREYLEMMRDKKMSLPVLVGGAVLNQNITNRMLSSVYENVHYCADAFDGLKTMENVLRGKDGTKADR